MFFLLFYLCQHFICFIFSVIPPQNLDKNAFKIKK